MRNRIDCIACYLRIIYTPCCSPFYKERKHIFLFYKAVFLSFIFLLFPLGSNLVAQSEKPTEKVVKKSITGHIINSFTKEPLENVKVDLLSPDSAFIDSTRTIQDMDDMGTYCYFRFGITHPGKYIIRCSQLHYETCYIPVDIKFHKRESGIFMGTFSMKRELKSSHILKEVTITATKIKFYNNNDTLVYNADAFQLADGSMLDALVKQLPGVVLKDDGRIFVNGKFVSSLLLNGKDLFKDENKLMLDNLPAYMVNKVAVYEKENEWSAPSGTNNKSLVMDIKLKKEYSIGLIGNVEAGEGSKNRYMSRLYAMHFTPHSTLNVFGNMNNLSNNQTPEDGGEWTPSDQFDGLQSRKTAGLNYGIQNKNITAYIRNKIEHIDADNQINTNSVSFLTGGNTYTRSQNVSRNYSTAFSTNGDILLKLNKTYLFLAPNFSYQNYRNHSFNQSGTFSDEPSKYVTSRLLDSLSLPNMGNRLRSITLNRYQQRQLNEGHSVNVGTSFTYKKEIPHTDDIFYIKGNFNYSDAQKKTYSHYRLDYPSTSSSVDYRNQYITTPDRKYDYNINAQYLFRYNLSDRVNINIAPYYKYSQAYHFTDQSYYRLDRLNGWGENSDNALGMLPSTLDYLTTARDSANSYRYHQYDFAHEAGLTFRWDDKLSSTSHLNYYFIIPFRKEKNRLNYQRNTLDTLFSRHVMFFDPSAQINLSTHNSAQTYEFDYDCKSTAPVMTYLVDVTDNTDPLNISKGNSLLKNTHIHTLSFRYSGQLKKQKMLQVNLDWHATQNAIAMGTVYDKSTGVRTTKPDNINGNWNGTFNTEYTTPLDKAQKWTFNTNTGSGFYHSVDLISVEGSTANARSTVNNLSLSETLKLDYHLNEKCQFGAKMNGSWTHSTSTREDFTTINAGNFNYGVTGQVELPWNMQLSSDFTEYSRRGYEVSSMNTNELVWNAKLVKRLKSNISIMLDGVDILGNLSNVQRTVNAQGQTETYYNVIPRYVMLHVVYRLNIQPKKRN